MKLGVVGKGGVGKTTVAALLAETYAQRGSRVLAVDTDSNPNLGVSLGLSLRDAEAVPVIPRAAVGGSGGNLGTAELLETYGRSTPSGVTLLSAMRIDQAGAGCTCGSHAAVRSILGAAIDDHADVTLVDMEAGLEHLSRSGGTLAYADVLLVVMEPTAKSVLTAARTAALADDLGIPRTCGVGNKAHLPADATFFGERCAEYGVELVGVVPYDDDVAAADRAGANLAAGQGEAVREAIDGVVSFIDQITAP